MAREPRLDSYGEMEPEVICSVCGAKFPNLAEAIGHAIKTHSKGA